MPPETAVAVREDQHPIIAKIDEKMPQIAGMLPDGMEPERFRKVVVQALVRNPELWECTPVSVVSAIVEAAQLGLEPTGVLGRAWLLPYRNKGIKEAKLIPGYRGYAELAWRADRIILKAEAVRTGDEFAYSEGIGADHFLRHVPVLDDPDREANDDNITFVYAVYTLADGRQDFAVMSRKAVEKIRARARYDNPVWASDFAEMAKKTVLRRLLKITPLSPEVQNVLGRDEAIDFDTPVARVANEKRDALRDRIHERTAAIRGEPTDPVESEGADDGAGVPASQPVGTPTPTGGSPAPKRDPWMARLHAVGADKGLDHDAIHAMAVERFGATSITDLSPSQRADLMEAVESAPPPKPGTDAYRALPSGEDRANARLYWEAHSEPEQASLAAALGAPESDA